jgi:hypothetical protein
MKERTFKTLDAFKTAAKAAKASVVKRNNERLGDFYIAERGGSPVGSFCAKYPRDSYLLTN